MKLSSKTERLSLAINFSLPQICCSLLFWVHSLVIADIVKSVLVYTLSNEAKAAHSSPPEPNITPLLF